MRRHEPFVLAACVFLSGSAALVAEVVWSRYLHLVFGSTSYSIATVVATYMAGLGLGSFLFGRIADRSVRPARLYALVEFAIGAYALASPLLLGGVERAFVALHRAFAPAPLAGALMKAALAAAVLLVPTVLMGGTLPLLARYLVGRGRDAGRSVGLLYGVNTLGAVAGAWLAGFLLVERLGLHRSLAVGAGANGLAAVLVFALATPPLEPLPAAGSRSLRRLLASEPVLLGAGLALFGGLGSLTAEVAWARVLALVIGSSTWSFALVLAGFLLGVGLGAAWIGRRGGGPEPLAGLAGFQLLAAAGAGVLLVGLEPLIRAFVVFQQNPLAGSGALLAFKTALVLVAVLPGTFGMGASFPLAVAAAARGSRAVGAGVGLVYAANTLGSIAGSLLAGFFFLTAMGSFATLRFAAWVHLAVGLAALAGAGARISPARRVAGLSGLAAAAAFLLLVRPWPAHLLSLGPFLYPRGLIASRLDLDRYLAGGRGDLLFSREGLSSVVSVIQIDYSRALRTMGKTDASTGGDMQTQVNLAVRPLLVHPEPRAVLVIGAGSGATAATAGAWPGVESIDVVEIEPAVIAAGALFEGVNRGIYRDRRTRVILEDGRNHLLTTDRRYDVIISEPSNPWMAGVANLFTSEFYGLVGAHLAEGGVFCQWVQRYDLSSAMLRRIAATLAAAFPEVELWQAGSADLLFLAGRSRFAPDEGRAASFVAGLGEDRERLLRILEAEVPEDLLAGRILDTGGVRRLAGSARPYRDDPPELEFASLRRLGEREWSVRLAHDLLRVRRDAPPGAIPGPPGAAELAEARIQEHLGDLDGALAASEAAASGRGSARYWWWTGEYRFRAGRAGEAVAAWRQAVAADPGHAPARVRLLEFALGRGDLAGAEEQLTAMPQRATRPQALLLEAELALRKGESERALARLARAALLLAELPDSGDHLTRMQELYRRLTGDPRTAPQAIRSLETYAEAHPSVLAWRRLAGEALEAAGQLTRAAAHYRRIVAAGPDVEAWLGIARCELAAGRPDAARAALASARRYQPWHPELRRLEGRLAGGARAAR